MTVGLAGGVGVVGRPNKDAKDVERRAAAAAGVLLALRDTARTLGRGGSGGLEGEALLMVGRGGRGREAW